MTVIPPAGTGTASGALYQSSLHATTAPQGWSSDPVCQFTSSGLIVAPSGGQAYICLAPVRKVANIAATVTVQQLSGSVDHAYGLAIRHNDPKSYYFFGVDGQGRYTFDVVVNDVSHTVVPFTTSPSVHSGRAAQNVLQIVARGTHLYCFVNGTPVCDITVDTFGSGTIGLRGINDGQVQFSNLTVVQA